MFCISSALDFAEELYPLIVYLSLTLISTSVCFYLYSRTCQQINECELSASKTPSQGEMIIMNNHNSF